MKITIKKEIEETAQIKIPYFFKIGYSSIEPTYHAIFSEERGMSINISDMPHIHCAYGTSFAHYFKCPDFKEISEEEFTEAFETTMERIQSMMPVNSNH